MDLIVIAIISLATLVVMHYLFQVNISRLKEIAENKQLDELTNKFPENRIICEKYLKMLNNEKVNIKEDETSNKQASLYIAPSNTIFIANIKNSYTRIQTIAHECLHSIQDKKMLMFNFVYSNVYIIYWIASIVLTLIGIFTNMVLQATILLFLGFIYYLVRSSLETEAMTQARYLSKEYMLEEKIISENEINDIVREYDKLNNMGIKMTQYALFKNCIIKVFVYCIIAFIKIKGIV